MSGDYSSLTPLQLAIQQQQQQQQGIRSFSPLVQQQQQPVIEAVPLGQPLHHATIAQQQMTPTLQFVQVAPSPITQAMQSPPPQSQVLHTFPAQAVTMLPQVPTLQPTIMTPPQQTFAAPMTILSPRSVGVKQPVSRQNSGLQKTSSGRKQRTPNEAKQAEKQPKKTPQQAPLPVTPGTGSVAKKVDDPSSNIVANLNKAVICQRYFSKGTCDFGQCCPFAHIRDKEQHPLPKQVCQDWLEEVCTRDKCPYFHGMEIQLQWLHAAAARAGINVYLPQDYMLVRNPEITKSWQKDDPESLEAAMGVSSGTFEDDGKGKSLSRDTSLGAVKVDSLSLAPIGSDPLASPPSGAEKSDRYSPSKLLGMDETLSIPSMSGDFQLVQSEGNFSAASIDEAAFTGLPALNGTRQFVEQVDAPVPREETLPPQGLSSKSEEDETAAQAAQLLADLKISPSGQHEFPSSTSVSAVFQPVPAVSPEKQSPADLSELGLSPSMQSSNMSAVGSGGHLNSFRKKLGTANGNDSAASFGASF